MKLALSRVTGVGVGVAVQREEVNGLRGIYCLEISEAGRCFDKDNSNKTRWITLFLMDLN